MGHVIWTRNGVRSLENGARWFGVASSCLVYSQVRLLSKRRKTKQLGAAEASMGSCGIVLIFTQLATASRGFFHLLPALHAPYLGLPLLNNTQISVNNGS